MTDEKITGFADGTPNLEAGERDLAFSAFQQPRSRPLLRRALLACISVVFMAALGFGAFFLILSRGPIEMAFLSDRIAVGLEQRFGADIDVDVGRTVLEKNDDGFSLHVLDIVLRETQGREILRSPDAVVAFSPLQLLRLSFVPDRLALKGMKMRAEITPEGDVLFTSAGASGNATTRLADVVSAVLGVGAPDAAGGWSALSIADASLDIDDRRNGKRLSFDNMNLAFGSPRSGVLEATGSLRKERDVVQFSLLSESADGGRRLKLGFADVGDHVVQAILGARAPYLRLAAKLSASIELVMGLDSKVKSFAFETSLGPGYVEADALRPGRLAIDRLRVQANWDSAEPKRATLDARFEGDGFKLGVSGPLAVPDEGLQPWRWDATGNGWTLPPLGAKDQPVVADKAEFRLDFDPKARKAKFTNVAIEGPATRLSLFGEMNIEEEGFGFSASVEATRMPLRAALRWWPSFLSPLPRDFLVRTVRDGQMQRLTVDAALPPAMLRKAIQAEPLPRDAIRVSVAVENATLELSEGLPPITGINGLGQLDALEAQGTFQKAQIEARGTGRRLQLADGAFNLDGLETWYPGARFRFRAAGPLDAVADVLRSPDIKGAHLSALDPADVKGQFEGMVSLQLPLAATISAAQVATTIEGRMTGVTIEKAIGKDRLENAVLTVSTDRSGLEIKGEGRWQGTPVSLTLENEADTGNRTAVLSMTLDDAAIKRRGIGLPGQLQGNLPVKIRQRGDGRENARTQVEVDLTRAAIDGLLPGLQKPAGRAGKLSFDAVERPTGYSVQNITLDSGSSQIRGQAEASAEGALTSARLSLFRLSPGDNVKLDYDRTGANAKVTIRGNNLDARPFLRSASQPDGAARKDGDLDLDIRTTLLSGHGGEVLTNAEARIAMRGAQLRQLNVTGRLNGKSVSLTGRGNGDAPLPITIEGGDAGALLRYFDLYGRMAGGEISGIITASPRRTTGYFIAKDFALRNEPAIRRLVSESQTDSARRGNVETEFSKIRVDFTREGNEIAVRDAVIFGPQLGLTFNGIVDPVRDRVSLSGTYVPAYGLNNAFAQIPIVGNILAGGRNEGLLAVTFGVAGKASQPTVTVNPLSAVAPGIFRKFFEFRNDRTGSTPPLSYNPAAN